jgi:phenylacetic acid degradation operon negative regulatory protein
MKKGEDCPSCERIERFKAQGRGQAGSVIVTVFGDGVLPRGGGIWLGSLIGLLAPLGLNERLVRTAVFRLAQDDWLEAVAQGRRADYRLTTADLRARAATLGPALASDHRDRHASARDARAAAAGAVLAWLR